MNAISPSREFLFRIDNFSDDLSNNLTNQTDPQINNLTHQTDHQINNDQLTTLTYTITFGFICACLCFLTITGNLLVLITFRRMRTVGNLFILSLATADLIVGCFVMPLAGIYAIMERWNMGLRLCQVWLSVDFTASTASIFNLLTLSLDRYWSITSPLQYLGKRTRTRALLLIGFAWGLSLLWVIPIFGWHSIVNNGTRSIDSDKCEPEYIHSKVFKVSTAIINFYLPLIVLMSLNGRIYYEIKRRYKNVLLQRHSTKLNDSITNNNNSNSLYSLKHTHQRNKSPSPVTMTLCDSDKQGCSTTINYIDNESLILTKTSPKLPTTETGLRINFKEKKSRAVHHNSSKRRRGSSLKRTYSFGDKKRCTQDELTWFAHRRELTHSTFPNQQSATVISNYKSPRLHVNDHYCRRKPTEYNSCRIYANKTYYQPEFTSSLLCRQCSLTTPKNSQSSSINQIPSPSTPMNIFNICHCCTSTIAVRSNSNIELSNSKRRFSVSSSSASIPVITINRKQPQKSSSTSSINRCANKIKQTTIWNQQEKAFRQLFAIVFGFTCCFLPYFIIYMVVAFCETCVPERIVTGTIWLGYVNSTMNPFLYVLSNKHFRRNQ